MRRGARAPQARLRRLLPTESARWRIHKRAHANAGCLLEAVAGTSECGLAPRERAVSLVLWASNGHTGRLGRIRHRAEARIHQTAVYFPRNRRDETRLRGCWFRGAACQNQKNALESARTSLSTAAAARSVHRYKPPGQRGHATGLVSAHRRDGMLRAAMYERDWHPFCIVCRSSSSSVVSGARTCA